MHEKKLKPGMPLKKLRLNRETIKTLTGDSLRRVAGGFTEASCVSCYSECACSGAGCGGSGDESACNGTCGSCACGDSYDTRCSYGCGSNAFYGCGGY